MAKHEETAVWLLRNRTDVGTAVPCVDFSSMWRGR